ncbi:MAG: hypothetical protein IT580_18020, partial [Verrucomicrobiales bacterium]|nr:hypothetical protein [Verrucomicrobiales bacterium]
AVALLKIVPDHQAALAELIRHLPTSNPQEARLTPDRSRSEAAAWLGEFVNGSGPLDSPPLQLVLEPLLREEIRQWSPRGTTHRFIHSMSRLAPDRTQALLREALATEAGPIAAGFLLNLDRGDAEATRILVHALESAPGTHIIAFTYLGNFASTNRAGMRFLHECLEHPETLANRNATPRVNADYVRLLARQALARIRYREARLRHGLPEELW